MNSYTPASPPTRGNALVIWTALVKAGLKPVELHYNPNNYGNGRESGWGTWAMTLEGGVEGFCGVESGRVYLQQQVAPYKITFLDTIQQEQVTQ